jgi:hypothetical protein
VVCTEQGWAAWRLPLPDFAIEDDAPKFFGRDTWYIHRFYGGVNIDLMR